MPRKVKELGQVYTPCNIVCDVLDAANYSGESILRKHIMENSCGPGAFLSEIVRRYIKAFLSQNVDSLDVLKSDLEIYIHAIDIDDANISSSISAMNDVASEYGLSDIKWDIIHGDSLTITSFDNKMDFVVGNPPYVRVHNLDNYDSVKKFSFTQTGMTDIYIVFFEIGFNMLKKGGVLSYITASSYYNSLAGIALRNYISKTRSLYKIMDLGHYNPFEETTYTTISCFKKGNTFSNVEYHAYDSQTGRPNHIDNIPYEELFVDGNIVLVADSQCRKEFANIYAIDRSKYRGIVVKNGFATLADKVFFSDDYSGLRNTIKAYKGSTGKWTTCIYPYDNNGNLIPFKKLDLQVQQILLKHRDKLEDRNLEAKSEWYSFGRTQAINDVHKNKIAINALLKDKDSIKIEFLPESTGVYSGIYILSDYHIDEIKTALMSDSFITYVKAIKKYKSGGYYTFSTEDVNKYLLYKLCNIRNTQSTLISFKEPENNEQPCQ